jgi:hypothetical protein
LVTVNELKGAVGRKGYLLVHGLEVKVEIMDVRQVFNRVDYLVQPEAGRGSAWVAAGTVNLIEPGTGGRRVILGSERG